MRKILFGLFVLALAAPALAEAPVCNEGRVEGIVRSNLAECIADAQRDDFEVSIGIQCGCPEGNYTANVVGTPHCRPNEPCPEIARIVGSLVVSCDFEVVSGGCGVAPQTE